MQTKCRPTYSKMLQLCKALTDEVLIDNMKRNFVNTI